MLIILFGLPGAGKSYLARFLEEHHGFYFLEGDNYLTQEIKECIATKTGFTQAMRDTFTEILVDKIRSIKEITNHEMNIVLSQALFKEKNREMIRAAFPEAVFFQIKAADNILLSRLSQRGGEVSVDYATQIRHQLELDEKDYIAIDNTADGSMALIEYIQKQAKPPFLLDELVSSKDERGLLVTASNLDEIRFINEFYLNFIQQKDELAVVIQQADIHVNCIMLQIYAAIVFTLSQSLNMTVTGQRFLERLRLLKHQANAREQLFIHAIAADYAGALFDAFCLYREIIIKWPRDLLAGLMVEFHGFELGRPDLQLAVWQSTIEQVTGKGYQEEGHFLASYAFALELSGQFEQAVSLAQRALVLQPKNPWAQHALVHAYSNLENHVDQGVALLEAHAIEWFQYGDFVRGHNYFHLALLYLNKNNLEQAFSIYDKHIKRKEPAAIYQQSDSIIFLWRLGLSEFISTDLKIAITRELNELYEHKAVQAILRDQQLFPFLSLLYFYLCLATRHVDEAVHILEERMSSNPLIHGDEERWNAARQMARGILEYTNENYAKAVELLAVHPDYIRIGGSDEQRSVFSETLRLARLKQNAINSSVLSALRDLSILNKKDGSQSGAELSSQQFSCNN